MPGMDGTEAARLIREAAPDGDTVIVALTADSSSACRRECRDAGMDDFLAKPFELAELQAVLSRWLTPAEPAAAAGEAEVIPVSTGTASGDDELLDWKAIESIRNLGAPGGGSLLERVIGIYFDDARSALDNLEAARADGDFDAIRAFAHKLKSSSGNVGARAMQMSAKAAEDAGIAGDEAAADAALAALRGQLEPTLDALAPLARRASA
ncbi:MAG: Hpt domain-containing protein [Pseudomonadota bacterium]